MLYKNHQVKWVDGKCPPIEHLSVHIKIRLISKINRCTWSPVYPVSVTGFCPSSHALFKSYLKRCTSSSLLIHFGRPLLTNTCMWHFFLHSDDITVSARKRWETKGGCRSLGCPSPFPSLSKHRSSPAHGLHFRWSWGLDETLVPSPTLRDP